MSRPAKTTRPALGRKIPAISAKSVDFPAPLGPISPRISRSATPKSTSRTAHRPPKRFVRPRPASNASAIRARSPDRPRARPEAVDQAEDATRFEEHDRHQEQTEGQQVEILKVRFELFADEREDDRPEQRAGDRSETADQRHDDERDRGGKPEDRIRTDKEIVKRVHGAAQAAQEGRNQKRLRLHERG